MSPRSNEQPTYFEKLRTSHAVCMVSGGGQTWGTGEKIGVLIKINESKALYT